MQAAQSRQKSYSDVRRKDLKFEVGDKMFLKVAPMKGVLRFEQKGKLSPRFVGPFEVGVRACGVPLGFAPFTLCRSCCLPRIDAEEIRG